MRMMRISMPGMVAVFALAATAVQAAPPAAAPAAFVPLSALVHPPLRIADAQVVDASGAAIGTVQRVEVTPAGVPTHVAVTPTGKPDQITVLDAGAVAYDAARNTIIARRHG